MTETARYTHLDMNFSIGHFDFTVINIVYEKFVRSIPSHCHSKNSYEIHYISKGKGKVILNGCDYYVSPHTLYITGPQVEHAQIPDLEDPMEEYCFYFKVEKRGTTLNPKLQYADELMHLFEQTRFWFGLDRENMECLTQTIFLELRKEKLGYILEVEALLKVLIIKLIRNYNAIPSPLPLNDKLYSKNDPYLIIEEAFLYDYKTLSLENLAHKLSLSTRQTERLLKEKYNKTFTEKRTEAKMSAAALLLTQSDYSITQISIHIGYSSVEHFSNAFKKYYKTSATTYRKKNTLKS